MGSGWFVLLLKRELGNGHGPHLNVYLPIYPSCLLHLILLSLKSPPSGSTAFPPVQVPDWFQAQSSTSCRVSCPSPLWPWSSSRLFTSFASAMPHPYPSRVWRLSPQPIPLQDSSRSPAPFLIGTDANSCRGMAINVP